MPIFAACAAVVFGASWLNSKAFVTPHTCKPEFLAEQAKIGNVMVSAAFAQLLLQQSIQQRGCAQQFVWHGRDRPLGTEAPAAWGIIAMLSTASCKYCLELSCE
jgi:hypothetical protein